MSTGIESAVSEKSGNIFLWERELSVIVKDSLGVKLAVDAVKHWVLL